MSIEQRIVLNEAGNTIVGWNAWSLYRKTDGKFPVMRVTEDERFFVFDADGTLRAGQGSIEAARRYMSAARVLVYRG